MERLKDKVIIVAGCGGIGDGLARRYAQEGGRLVLGDLDEYHARTLASELDPTGERIIGAKLDGAEDASIAAIVALAMDKFGRLDGLHANYAIFPDGLENLGLEIPLDVYDEMQRVNQRGYFLCARHAVPAMVQGGGGSLVFTSSVEAFIGAEVRFAYAMNKSAIHGLMRNIAVRYGRDGIRANAICPGFIGHDGLLAKLPEGSADYILTRTPVKDRVGLPRDIAAMGAFLLSDDAGYVTGQVMAVDGGLTMRP